MKGMVSFPNAKVEALKNYKMPITKTNLKAFLGTNGYYCRFVSNFAQKAYSLTDATKESDPKKLVWNDEILSEFTTLCNELCSVSVLHIIPTE